MNTPSRINVETIEVVGSSSSSKLIDVRNTNRIQTFVALLTDRESVEDKVEALRKKNPTIGYYYGRRCKSVHDITNRITSALGSHADKLFSSELLAEMWINAQVEHLSGSELAKLTEMAIEDCAEADYHYSFVKEH